MSGNRWAFEEASFDPSGDETEAAPNGSLAASAARQ
jgi:hypothetical protein